MNQSWETLRKDARRLETEIDAKLVTYSKLSASLSNSHSRVSSFDSARSATGQEDPEAVQRRPGQNSGGKELASVEHMTGEMEALLSRLQRVVDAMAASIGTATSTPPAALTHTLQRHTEILHDYTQEFRKIRGSVSSVRERAELLSGATTPTKQLAQGDSAASTDVLFAERASLNGARVGADAAVQTGLNIKEDLERQRALFASMVERMETMSEGMPAVNRLIGQIRRKKKRDIFIFAGVIGTLLFVTFSWKGM